jgi:hypothetical protein
MRRVTGVLLHPRATMAEVVRHPAFITTWVVVLLVAAVCAGLLLSTPIGQQLLVDERVRVTEAMGGRVDDASYARLQNDPPVSIYLTSGGRLLLTPPVTVAVAVGVMALARRHARVTFVTALAITVHATVVLGLQQVIATPLHYAYESLTNPTNLAGLLGVFDEGSWPARLLGAIDVFGLWWLWLLALGLGAATGRPARRYVLTLLAVYMGGAAIVAAVFVVLGNGV